MQRRIHQWTDVQQSVGAAAATFQDPSLIITPNESAVYCKVKFIGRESTTKKCAIYILEGSFQNVANALAQQGNLVATTPFGDASMTGGTPLISLSFNMFIPQIVGIALLTIDWIVHCEWVAYAP